MADKYRLVTRSDFDGIVCAVLLQELDLIDEITFVHPKDMQDGAIDISDRDITTNLPYVDGVHLSFDHHRSEVIRVGEKENNIIDANAPSAARVLYDYYGGHSAFANINVDLMAAVDAGDSAQFSLEQVLNPTRWALLNFLMDARTGLGRFRDFNISNYQLMMDLIGYCRKYSIEEILQLPDIKERVDIYFQHEAAAKAQLEKCASVHKNLVVLNLIGEEQIWPTNRFTIYALFPQTNISIHAISGKQDLNRVYAIGKSIFDRSSNTDIGELCLKYGGGGHTAAGTCQIDTANADQVLGELIEKITSDG
jgi:nanoRNase/pAp phosphatase (c-di-AMP/oligoRNAs hydrolase)